MQEGFLGYKLLEELCEKHPDFKRLIKESIQNGKVRFFGEEEWDKIKSQNFVSPSPLMKEFIDMFALGLNKGNCKNAAFQLSYSYNDVDIVCGTVPILKGSLNAEKEGGHWWLETSDQIIDTSLLLVIDKELKEKIGYKEESRLTRAQLRSNRIYKARKEFTCDPNLKPKPKGM